MNQSEKKYIEIVQSWIEESKKQQIFLEKDDRLDEANLEKVKCNIYEIFEKMFYHAKRATKTEEDFMQTYLAFHQKIPANWKQNYQQAKEEDSIEMYVEELKLETANKIEQLFKNLWCLDGSN